MSDQIEFVSNYSDLSNERGFQFEFTCNRCATGYRTPFQAWAVGTATDALHTASNLFGGLFNRAASVGEQARSAAWQQARDKAFREAANKIRPSFIQCPRYSSWVCRKSCWNEKRGLCKSCAPDLGVEMAAAQASRAVEKAWENAAASEEDQRQVAADKYHANLRATCPNCNAPLDGQVKFCPECGAKIESAKFCAECGSKLTPGAKFCPECGAKAV
jgi:hypothetical protein